MEFQGPKEMHEKKNRKTFVNNTFHRHNNIKKIKCSKNSLYASTKYFHKKKLNSINLHFSIFKILKSIIFIYKKRIVIPFRYKLYHFSVLYF